jgi:endonuclease-8
MPEGDTVWLTARRLDQALAGEPLTEFDLRVPAFATADLRGDTVVEVVARGKHILIRFAGGLTLHTHLRMDGSWRLARAGERRRGCPQHQVRVLLANRSWQAIGCRVHDIALVETTDEGRLVGHLGPDLLAADFGASQQAEAVRRLGEQPHAEIGPSLLDQRNLAGIGNLYKSEVLFINRINPWCPIGAVPDLDRVVGTARRLLYANRNHPEQSTTGLMGRDQQHWVYRRDAQPCRVCGTPINRAEQGVAPQQRSTYWCPACQPAAS